MASAAIIMTTAPGQEDSARLASILLEERLAACVQEIPITSTYRWEGGIRRDGEILLLVKTSDDRAAAAVARLEAAHPYDVPEVLVLRAADGAAPYLAWLADETGTIGTEG